MGGNSSYNKTLDHIKGSKRTHQEYHDRIGGHKILLLNANTNHSKLPMNSNSESPIYLGGQKIPGSGDKVQVTTIGIYEKHKCVGQIDLKFDKNGNLIPFSKSNPESSHFHYFVENPKTGKVGRKSHDKTNTHLIDSKYDALIQKIVDYNKKHK